MKRYRYIGCGTTTLNDCVNEFRLLANRTHMGGSCIRIEIPNDMELIKYTYDSYSTTGDKRLIKDLNPCAMIYKNGRWVIQNELLKYPIHEWYKYKNK